MPLRLYVHFGIVPNLMWAEKKVVRQDMIKLDCLTMLYQRHLSKTWAQQGVRVSRNLNPDSSPQHSYDFFTCVEELFVRDLPNQAHIFAPLGGFTWIRRRMPTVTIAKKQGSTAKKTMKLVHSASLENGDSDGVWRWRQSVKNYLADHGTEKGPPRMPLGGKDVDVRTVSERVAAPDFNAQGGGIHGDLFLMNAMSRPEHIHICMNALENAVRNSLGFEEFVNQLRAMVRLTGDRANKEALLETSFKRAFFLSARLCIVARRMSWTSAGSFSKKLVGRSSHTLTSSSIILISPTWKIRSSFE